MKSENVFFLCWSLPSSYQARPSSWPPRTWAIATDEASVEQAETLRKGTRAVDAAVAVRAVPLQEERGGAVEPEALPENERDRNLSCRRRWAPRCGALVARGFVAAADLITLQQRLRAGRQVHVVRSKAARSARSSGSGRFGWRIRGSRRGRLRTPRHRTSRCARCGRPRETDPEAR